MGWVPMVGCGRPKPPRPLGVGREDECDGLFGMDDFR
jgi:hypothetical protein